MIDKSLYKTFVETLRQRIPKRSELTKILVELLDIDKEAIYRRMRGEVAFTFSEIAKIARRLNVSIDEVIGMHHPGESSFRLSVREPDNEMERHRMMMEQFEQIVGAVRNLPDTVMGEATNLIPQPLFLKYENLTRFYFFKWKQQCGKPIVQQRTMGDVVFDNESRRLQRHAVLLGQQIAHVIYVLDPLIFRFVVNDLIYYRSIRLISDKDTELIKTEVLSLMDDIEELCETGRQKTTGMQVDFYIAHNNLDTSYSYIQSPNFKLSMVKSFVLNGVVSTNREAFENVHKCFHSIRRQSTRITETGERERIVFFREQRELLGSL